MNTGIIPNTRIRFTEIIPYDINTEKGKWHVIYDTKVAGVLVATGHPMCPSEFSIEDENVLCDVLKDFRDNGIITNPHNVLSFKEDYILLDAEEVARFNKNGVQIIEEDLLAFFISEMSAEINDMVEF